MTSQASQNNVIPIDRTTPRRVRLKLRPVTCSVSKAYPAGGRRQGLVGSVKGRAGDLLE